MRVEVNVVILLRIVRNNINVHSYGYCCLGIDEFEDDSIDRTGDDFEDDSIDRTAELQNEVRW